MKKFVGFLVGALLCFSCVVTTACAGGGNANGNQGSSSPISSSDGSQGGQNDGSSSGSQGSQGSQGGQNGGSSDGSQGSQGSQGGQNGGSSSGSQGSQGSQGGQGGPNSGGKVDCDVAVFFNEKEGVLVLEGDDWAEVTLTIGGIAYPVTSPEIDLKKLGLRDGEYAVEITYDGEDGVTSLGGGCFQTTKDEYWGAITFFDEDKRLICRYFIEEGYRLKEEDFPEFPIREGVTYEWDCQIAVGEEVPGNLDVGLRLTYTEYTVTYQKNGGNFFSVNYPTKYTAEAQRKLPALQKDGYLFAGWYPSADFSGARIYEVGGPYIYGNLTLYAKFEPLSADLQVLFSAIATTMSAEKVTIKGDGSEMGYDFSNGDFYAYEKYSGKLMYVISGGKYYDFNEKISYPYERESNIAEALGLEEVLSYCAEIRYDGETNGVRNYSFMSRHGEKILTFGVKDNKIVSASFVDGYTVNLSVTYDCQKQSVNESEFTSVKKVRVQRLTGLENENWTEEIVFKANENVEDNQRIQNMMQTLGGEWQFKGFYSDESCTQKVNSYADLGTNLYLLFINPQTLIRETEIVLRLTCHCPECEGKMTEYRTTLNELYELGNKSGETQDHLTKIAFGDFYDVGDGYVMEGLYVSYGQYDELFNCSLIEMILKERYEQGQTIDGMVFGLYTKKRTVSTHKIIVKGFDKDIVHYVVEGGYFNWNFLFESVPDGYVLKALYENEQCTSGEHSAFTDGGSWEVLGDETVYAKFVQDERIEVTVHFGYLTRAKLDGSYYQQGQAESKRSESYTFKMFADEKLSYYLQSLSVDGYPSNNSVITGYYYDEEFTRPVGQNDLPTDGMEVYAYLGELVEITLHYVSGFEDTRMEFKGRVLSEVINEYEVQNQRTEEYVSVMKFYSDEERTKEIFSVIEGDIYVGYKEVPHITIVCPDGCNLLAEEHRIKAENGQIGWAIENHRSKTLAGHDNPIRFYYDEAFTRPVKPDDFVTDSVTIYGKEEYERRSYTVHCGCLTHGNSGIQLDACDEEDAVDYVKLVCDFGRPVFHFSFYSNEERTQGFSFYGSNEETGINEVWLQKFTLVYVYAEGSQARADGKMLVDTIFDVLEFFYIEKTGDGLSYELKGSYEKHWVMYLDNTFTVARALPYEYELTAGEKFYFREETYNRYENLITLKADGFEDYSFYAGTGISGATSVERRAFAGKRIEGLYLDSALTKPVVVGKDIDSGIRANWDVVLYARVVDMPTMIIYSDASTGDTNDYYTFEIYSDEPYRHFLWNVLQNDYYYSQWIDGKVLEVCKNEDGTEPIDLSDLAEAGEYYFRYNAYSKNNVKITLSGVEYPEEQYVYLADCIKIGYENYFYLTKGKTFADVEKIMERMALGVVAENGQSFSLGMQENGTHGLGGGIKIRYYSDSAMTNEITANTVLNADTTIYVKLDFTNAEKVVVHLENKGTIVFYTGDHSYFQLSEFFRNCVYNTSISPDMYERYPKLFAYGAIKAVYTDSAMTELYDYGNMNATDLYCRLAPIYTIRILFADGKVYQKQFVTAELSLRDVFGSGIAGSCEQRYGYTSVLAYDKEGKNLVDEETERVTGSKDYYIVYVRQEGYVSVKLVCSCGTSHKDCDVWLWGMSFANGEQMRMIGNADEFCVTEGYNIQAILLELSYRLHGNIEYYSDSAMTKKLTDFTVNSDTVVYVKVVVVIA